MSSRSASGDTRSRASRASKVFWSNLPSTPWKAGMLAISPSTRAVLTCMPAFFANSSSAMLFTVWSSASSTPPWAMKSCIVIARPWRRMLPSATSIRSCSSRSVIGRLPTLASTSPWPPAGAAEARDVARRKGERRSGRARRTRRSGRAGLGELAEGVEHGVPFSGGVARALGDCAFGLQACARARACYRRARNMGRCACAASWSPAIGRCSGSRRICPKWRRSPRRRA